MYQSTPNTSVERIVKEMLSVYVSLRRPDGTPNSRVDRSARSSVDVNLEYYARARSRQRSAASQEVRYWYQGLFIC